MAYATKSKNLHGGLFFPFWDSGTQKTASHSSARPVCCNHERIHRILVCLRVLARERCVAGSHAVARPSDLRRSYGGYGWRAGCVWGAAARRGRSGKRSRADGQPRVPRVECRFSGWIFRPVARRAVHQLARAVLRGDGDGAVAGRACSVWLSLVLAICVRWRQARFSETHAFDRRALAQALRAAASGRTRRCERCASLRTRRHLLWRRTWSWPCACRG